MSDEWTGCYVDSWKGIITPESFLHPAKMSYALTRRIFEHARDEGWIKPGDTVVDPFGGIGSTGIVGAEAGLQVVMCELEPKFVALNQANIERNRWRWTQFNRPIPRVVQGDSRRLCEVLAAADLVVSSPPYSEGLSKEHTYSDHDKRDKDSHRRIMTEKGIVDPFYGHTPGQLGALPAGDVAAVVGSQPFCGEHS